MDNYAGNVQSPQSFQIPNMQQSAFGAFNSIGNLSNSFGGLGSSVLPQAEQTANNLFNNPYAGGFQTGAGQAANLGTDAALAGFQTGANNIGIGQSLVPYASQVLQTGMDPQSQLYNQTLQQVTDQSNVNNAQSGVATTPYGAGLTNQADANFNINWQNQQLNRQTQALGAAGGALQTGTGISNTGVNQMNAAPGQLVQSAMLPYATYSDIGQGQNQALSSLLGLGSSGEALGQAPIQDYLSYLGVGNQSDSVSNQLFGDQLQQSNLSFNQLGTLAGLGYGLGSTPMSSMAPQGSAFGALAKFL